MQARAGEGIGTSTGSICFASSAVIVPAVSSTHNYKYVGTEKGHANVGVTPM